MSNRLTVEVHRRLNPVSASEWNYLFHNSANTASMIQHLELVGLEGFSFHSILVRLHHRPVLLLPLFETQHNLTSTMKGQFLKFAQKIDLLLPFMTRLKIMRVGVVDQQCGQIGYCPELSPEDLDAAWDLGLKSLDDLAKSLKVQIIAFTEFTPETGRLLPMHKMRDYCTAPGAPFCRMPVDFDSLESYLKLLDKDMRHYMRRSLKHSQPLELVRTRQPEAWLDEIYGLYLGQVERSELNLNGTQCRNYFATICRIDPSAHFALYLLDGRVISFELLTHNQDTITSKYIGLDPELGRKYKVYFRSWLDLIQYCLDNQIKVIDLGCTHESLKVQIGAKQLVPSFVMFRHLNPLINLGLHQFKSHLAYDSEVPVPQAQPGSGWLDLSLQSARPALLESAR
jgi:hypothetical protein